MTLGNRIKKAREKLGLSQTEFGIECGFADSPQSRISNYEQNRREPTIATLRIMSRVADIPLIDFIEELDDSDTIKLHKLLSTLPHQKRKAIINSITDMIHALK